MTEKETSLKKLSQGLLNDLQQILGKADIGKILTERVLIRQAEYLQSIIDMNKSDIDAIIEAKEGQFSRVLMMSPEIQKKLIFALEMANFQLKGIKEHLEAVA